MEFTLGRAERVHYLDHHMEQSRWNIICSVPLDHPWVIPRLVVDSVMEARSKELSVPKATTELLRHGVLRRGEALGVNPLGYVLISELIDVVNLRK